MCAHSYDYPSTNNYNALDVSNNGRLLGQCAHLFRRPMQLHQWRMHSNYNGPRDSFANDNSVVL